MMHPFLTALYIKFMKIFTLNWTALSAPCLHQAISFDKWST